MEGLPLSNKFTYPLTMVKFSDFRSYLETQPKIQDMEDDLISRLSGMGVKYSSFNMNMTNRTLPYTNFHTPDGWQEIFESKTGSYELNAIKKRLQELALKGNLIYPHEEDIFDTFKKCPPHRVKVVIIGQEPQAELDPLLGMPAANGKAYSGRLGGQITTALINIFNEIRRTYPGIPLEHADLTSWNQQGVLLLNSQLTVTKSSPGSHTKLKIWNYWIEYVIRWISDNIPGVIFLLWGSKAESFTMGDNPPIGKRAIKQICGSPIGKNNFSKPFVENSHFAFIYYEIVRQNQEIYKKNVERHAEGLSLLPYKEQINWALVKPVRTEVEVKTELKTEAVEKKQVVYPHMQFLK